MDKNTCASTLPDQFLATEKNNEEERQQTLGDLKNPDDYPTRIWNRLIQTLIGYMSIFLPQVLPLNVFLSSSITRNKTSFTKPNFIYFPENNGVSAY